LANTAFDWNFTTTPQTALNGRSVQFERGHGLGGSSSVSELITYTIQFICSTYLIFKMEWYIQEDLPLIMIVLPGLLMNQVGPGMPSSLTFTRCALSL